jgi:hypothetical protein
VHDEQGQRRGDDVPDGGEEPDQRIEAEAHVGAGDHKRGVEQGRKRVHPGNAGASGAGTGKVEVEAIGGGHRVHPPRPEMGMRGGERKAICGRLPRSGFSTRETRRPQISYFRDRSAWSLAGGRPSVGSRTAGPSYLAPLFRFPGTRRVQTGL